MHDDLKYKIQDILVYLQSLVELYEDDMNKKGSIKDKLTEVRSKLLDEGCDEVADSLSGLISEAISNSEDSDYRLTALENTRSFLGALLKQDVY